MVVDHRRSHRARLISGRSDRVRCCRIGSPQFFGLAIFMQIAPTYTNTSVASS
jgi:hypothetical protein